MTESKTPEQLAREASELITATLAAPEEHSEAVLDHLIAQGRDVTDAEIAWGTKRPMGAERVFDFGDLMLTLDGPERGPSAEEMRAFRAALTKGDRLSTMSRATQWVVTTSRGRSVAAWLIQHPPGEESDPDEPVHVGADGWAVYELTAMAHLRREGRALGHCVGSSSAGYWRDVKAGRCAIYSVRHDGAPVCTVEVRNGKIVQTQGKSGLSLHDIPRAAETWLAAGIA